MDQKLKRKWIKALRSGKYEQGGDHLKRGNRFCCLGVLADIQGCTWERGEPTKKSKNVGMLHQESVLLSPSFCGIRKSTQNSLAEMNDNGSTFAEIADYIEKRM